MYYLNNLVRRILCVIFAMTLLAYCTGDMWDAQKDMVLAMFGSTISAI